MTKARINLGKQGEELAAAYLQKKGFLIKEKNYRQKVGEIDIIAQEGSTLVFVEVKTRSSLQFGQPYEAITHHKQRQLRRVAEDYLSRNNKLNTIVRFDVISILMHRNKPPAIEHLPDCV